MLFILCFVLACSGCHNTNTKNWVSNEKWILTVLEAADSRGLVRAHFPTEGCLLTSTSQRGGEGRSPGALL